ncbi:MAG: von Willebrand factor type A domain-containing protein [Oscillospiraceae bacterium]|nr:von Willebrand factor type A domain-containing protein [Oscillospiraceae bacterium]
MNNKKMIAALTAAVLCTGMFCFPASAKVDMDDLPTPISGDKNIVTFQRTRPVLEWGGADTVYNRGSRFRRHLEWSEVDGALFYRVYSKAKSEKNYSLAYETFDTSVLVEYYEDTYFKVQAVTYSASDKQYKSLMSKAVKFKATEPKKREPIMPISPYDDGVYAYEGSADDGDEIIIDPVMEEAEAVSFNSPVMPVPAPSGGAVAVTDPQKNNTEEYGHAPESGFKKAGLDPVSTFSVDVDTASYTNVRRMINDGQRVPEEAVRVEEFINYFDYDYPVPENDENVSVYTELAPCPWNDNALLMMTGVKAKNAETTPRSNFVFLIDVSGSMYSEDKLPLAVESINMLTKTLTQNDRISIVTYSGEERVVLAGGNGKMRQAVSVLTNILEADGVTNGESGMKAAYELAEKYYIEGGNNRIILMTDGDLNVGIQSEDELKEFISEKRESGVYFTVLGFGDGNIKDNKMEALADNGNGSYHYIDIPEEAQRVLVDERESTLFTQACDVKIQVEFNPAAVGSYRLIGYDNRRLNNEDFTDDSKDAGEMGAGQNVTALYEIIPAKGLTSALKYQKPVPGSAKELATVKVRYKKPGEGTSREIEAVVDSTPGEASENLLRAASAAVFGMVLADSEYKGNADLYSVMEMQSALYSRKKDKEFGEMIEKYVSLYGDIDKESDEDE